MSDLFLKRMSLRGSYVGDALKKQSDDIMLQTFMHDPHTKPIRVYFPEKDIDVETYGKYQYSTKYSIAKDQVDHHLQFRPKEHYPLGCYVDIPADDGTIETWLIVGRDDNPQFVKYNILKCNWNFKWIIDNTIYSCTGVIRSRNSYNSGVWNDGFITSVENQLQVWLPSTLTTSTIYYDQRFLISDKRPIPISWYVTKVEDSTPFGITKLTLKQDFFNPSRDNAELMIADYYKDNITLEDVSEKDIKVQSVSAHIDISSWNSPKIVIGSKFSKMLGMFKSGNETLDMKGVWSTDISEEDIDKFSIETDDTSLLIKCERDYSLVGKVITITFSDETGTYSTTQEIEVTAR